MIKQILLLLKIFPFLAFTSISDEVKDSFSIQMTTVEKVEKPGEFEVKLHFTRGGIKGFAKLTEQLPNGFSAEAISMGDATFSCENGMLKILWLNLPEDKTFDASYKIIVAANAPAEINLSGKFSYIENNEKRVFSIPAQKIICASAAELLASEKEAAEKAKKSEPQAQTIRKIRQISGDVYEIEIWVEKQSLEGFTKIEEITPMGSKAQEKTTENAVFSFVNKKVKFVWMSPPAADKFKVSYLLDLSGASNKDAMVLKGEFSFLANGQTRKIPILNEGEKTPDEAPLAQQTPPAKSDVEPPAPKAEPTPPSAAVPQAALPPALPTKTDEAQQPEPPLSPRTETPVSPPAAQTPVLQPSKTPPPAEKTEAPVTPKQTEPVLAPVSKPEPSYPPSKTPPAGKTLPVVPPVSEEKTLAEATKTLPIPPVSIDKFSPPVGLIYRVQIAAGKNLVDAAYFEKRHMWSTEFFIENHDGWVKYTTGKHPEYKAARDARELIKEGGHKFDGPFVTAYNNGQRITVQEALMISNQKWFK